MNTICSYLLSPTARQPGKFLLSYLLEPASTPRHEYITVSPRGYHLRHARNQCTFKSFNALLAWFKMHYDEPLDGHIDFLSY